MPTMTARLDFTEYDWINIAKKIQEIINGIWLVWAIE